MQFDILFDDRQADACAFIPFPLGPGGFEIALEYEWDFLFRDADSCVGDFDHKLAFVQVYVEREQDGAALRRVFAGVGQQIVHYCLHLDYIDRYRNPGLAAVKDEFVLREAVLE